MRSIAIINQKGGSGKTTTSVNVAATLAERKRKVLLIDLDPQGSATSWLGSSGTKEALYEVFTANRPLSEIITSTDVPGVDLVASSHWLIGVEKALAHEVGAETILKSQLKKLSKSYDYVLIDCPPNLSILTINALCAVN